MAKTEMVKSTESTKSSPQKDFFDFTSTAEIEIPKDPFERIIGQPEAVEIARMVPVQRRHLLLVGPPGTGKSMIAQAIASVMPKPRYEISVLENPQMAERPLVEIRTADQIDEKKEEKQFGREMVPMEVPAFVTERLGFRCRRCATLSSHLDLMCPQCGAAKSGGRPGGAPNVFDKFMPEQLQMEVGNRIAATRRSSDGREEVVIFERSNAGKIYLLTQDDMKKMEEHERQTKRKVIVALTRSTFVQASGATETELLGDIRHDPYGSNPQIGTPAYQRVIPGAIHDAHEGVLFIDELSTLGNIQRYILTAMQDKKFPIIGHNPMSSGAATRVEGVPCEFIFVGACNINDLRNITPPLRSRIRGDGYEVLMNSHMEDSLENQMKMVQFIAQEIIKDGKIPHANKEAVMLMLEESRDIAKRVDKVRGITLRLRNLGGIIKMAGDLAKRNGRDLIEKQDVLIAIRENRPIEERIREKYGTWWNAEAADHGLTGENAGAETA